MEERLELEIAAAILFQMSFQSLNQQRKARAQSLLVSAQ